MLCPIPQKRNATNVACPDAKEPLATIHVRDPSTRASGGIGRRAGFRFLCPRGRGGSTPPSPTPRSVRSVPPTWEDLDGLFGPCTWKQVVPDTSFTMDVRHEDRFRRTDADPLGDRIRRPRNMGPQCHRRLDFRVHEDRSVGDTAVPAGRAHPVVRTPDLLGIVRMALEQAAPRRAFRFLEPARRAGAAVRADPGPQDRGQGHRGPGHEDLGFATATGSSQARA